MVMATILLLLLLAQQAAATPAPVRPEMTTFEDIQIGMPGDAVTGALVRLNYRVEVPELNNQARIVNFNGKYVGSFFVDEKGQVRSAHKRIYDTADDGDSAIALGEALYWLIHDQGAVLATVDKDRIRTRTEAVLTTEELVSRDPGSSIKEFWIETKSGADFNIVLTRGIRFSMVTIDELAPFPQRR